MKKIILPIFALIFSASIFAQTAGTLTVTATVSSSSTYIYSVWITSSTGTYIRTLTHYGNSYSTDLVNWYSASSGATTNATTGATKSSTATITSTWDGMNISKSSLVPDGSYIVKIEMTTESYGKNSKLVTGTFTKGTTDQTVTPTTVSPIGGVSLKWVHVSGTGIQDVEMNKLYSVYPNPAISSIFVSGSDINEVEICSLAGKSILISKEQRIDVSALPKGFYLAVIRSKVGTVLKKFEKI
ncbi:MAG: DUF2271 domain-containing protein [Paludibacter sp.]